MNNGSDEEEEAEKREDAKQRHRHWPPQKLQLFHPKICHHCQKSISAVQILTQKKNYAESS